MSNKSKAREQAIVAADPRHRISLLAGSVRPDNAPPPKPPLARALLYTGGIAVFLIAAFGTYQFRKGQYEFNSSRDADKNYTSIPEDVSDRFNKIAKTFDKEVGFYESFSGLNRIRSGMIKNARGNVLEVSVGTDRNSSYYDVEKCNSIIMLDQSQEMIDIARRKFKSEFISCPCVGGICNRRTKE